MDIQRSSGKAVRAGVTALLAGTGFFSIVPGASAQATSRAAATQLVAPANATEQIEEVVVTARLRSENLQNVPGTVDVVGADEIQKLNLLNFTDLSAVVPGLDLTGGNVGFNATASIRGVSFNPSTGSQPTVAFYVNDAPVQNNFVSASLFDIGQIEVLRGPQGTLRGEPAPSGSITLTTRLPDLESYGGYATVTVTHVGNVETDGAVNVPLIKGKLAVRLAGVIDRNDADGVKSLNNPHDPFAHDTGWRASVLFEPTDKIKATVMYQHLDRHDLTFEQVTGAGAPGGANPNAPAGYNGAAIEPQDRLAVQNQPNDLRVNEDLVTGHLQWDFLGQELNYVGSWFRYPIRVGFTADPGNQMPAATAVQVTDSTQQQQTHELRISSNEPGRFWDYIAGVFYRRTTNKVDAFQVASYLPGALGTPLSLPDPFQFSASHQLMLDIHAPSSEREISGFAHVTFHLPDNTELTGGVRYIDYKRDGSTGAMTLPGLAAFDASRLGGLPCSAIGLGSTYPGTCDAPVAPVVALPTSVAHIKDHPWIYSASISHRFTDGLMAYFTYGRAWRPGSPSVGIFNASNDPTLNSLLFVRPEQSDSFEGGVKTSFLDNRGFLDIAYYHQIYHGLIYETLPILYLSDNGSVTTVTPFAFNVNANAVVNGVDAQAGFQITPDWNVTGSLSYASGHITGSQIPCNPPGGGTTTAAFPPGTYVFLCSSHANVSQSPDFAATLQSEYSHPVVDNVDGFVRGLLSIYGSNPNLSQSFKAPAYALFNLYLGVRSDDGTWEAMFFAKNLFNTQETLSVGDTQIQAQGLPASTFGSSGYYGSTGSQNGGNPMVTPRRMFGLTLSYYFGPH